MAEHIYAYGHKNVTSGHNTTFEVTKDIEISKRADCIIGVNADKGISDLSEEFKSKAKDKDATIEVTIIVDDLEEKIIGKGHPDLTFTHKTDIVVRKSDFICSRTLMIKADKSAKELNEEMIERLKEPYQRIELKITMKNAPVAQPGRSD